MVNTNTNTNIWTGIQEYKYKYKYLSHTAMVLTVQKRKSLWDPAGCRLDY